LGHNGFTSSDGEFRWSQAFVYCGAAPGFLGEPVALGHFAVHSDVMSNSGAGGGYYWCLRHNRVETGDNMCAARDRLGPYPTAAEAERAMDKVAERNAEWDAEDARWAGEDS
jgi:hypothetical protein